MHFLLLLQSSGPSDITSPWGLFKNTFPLTISLPIPFPLPILCTLLLSGAFVTTLGVLCSLAIGIAIAIAMTSHPTTQCIGVCAVLLFIIVVYYHIPIPWSNGEEVICHALPQLGDTFLTLTSSLP